MNELPPDAWVPVPLRWRHVTPGDVFVGRENQLWQVLEVVPGAELRAVVRRVGQTFEAAVDPDETVQVLIPVTERDAVELCREQLGARLVEQRSIGQGTA